MKIERLYKLNQFVEYLRNEMFRIGAEDSWNLTIKYNQFLKQPLTKEMFVNNESKDWFNKDDSINVKIQLKWMEAEKKVIFEDGYKKAFDNPLKFRTNNVLINFSSMGSLAEKTNGELKLKNFEI